MSPVESYPVSCYNCLWKSACGSLDHLYINREADEDHGDEHRPEEHLGHYFPEPVYDVQNVQVLSTLFTKFGIT